MRTWLAWVQSSLLLRDRLDAELVAEHDLSLAEYEVLAFVSQAPAGRLRMAELAATTIVSRSRLTHLVDRLVRRGLPPSCSTRRPADLGSGTGRSDRVARS